MGYEVYLTSNSIGSNSEKARREYIAYSMTKRGSDRSDQRGRILPKGECFCIRVSTFFFSSSCYICFGLSCYIVFCIWFVPMCLCKLLGLCFYAYFVGFMICTLFNAAFYAMLKSVLLSKCLAFCFMYCHSCALVRLFLDAYT